MNTARFTPGQKVRIAARTPPLHHRVPSYVKGRTGFIERVCGRHAEPERAIAGDLDARRQLYRVRIPQHELWASYDGASGDQLELEVFEHWLEAAQ